MKNIYVSNHRLFNECIEMLAHLKFIELKPIGIKTCADAQQNDVALFHSSFVKCLKTSTVPILKSRNLFI